MYANDNVALIILFIITLNTNYEMYEHLNIVTYLFNFM